jgi:hypothetical protein
MGIYNLDDKSLNGDLAVLKTDNSTEGPLRRVHGMYFLSVLTHNQW